MDENNIDSQFLLKNGIDNERIVKRYISILRRIASFISMKKIAQNVIVNYDSLKTAVYDFFVDIARVKEFHNIDKVNTEKIYGYMAYWLLKRKPLQVKLPFPGDKFINELFVTSFLISNILAEKNIDSAQCSKNAAFEKFKSLLFYHLKYRSITQQSLELMIEAFFCGCDFIK